MIPESALPARHVPGAPNKAALEACLQDIGQPRPGALALVLEVDGHAYAHPGALVHFTAAGRRCGWVSPGCLEGELLVAANAARADGRVRLLDLDNRDLSDVFSGAGAGCRGRQRVLVLPLEALPGLHPLLASYREHGEALRLSYTTEGQLCMRTGTLQAEWSLPVATATAALGADGSAWILQLAPLPRALICGAGPESEILLPLLDRLGWRVDLFESRPEWAACSTQVERLLPVKPTEGGYDAVLVMAHHFGNDREALAVLADWQQLPAYIGLLGPELRRDDLLATLPGSVRDRLGEKLESPAGLPWFGHGAAAIALSLAARLQTLAQRLDHEHARRCGPVPASAAIRTTEAPPC